MEEKPKIPHGNTFKPKRAKINFELGDIPVDPEVGWAELERRVKTQDEMADIGTQNQVPFPPMK